MNKREALEIAKDRIENLKKFVPENKSETQIASETLEFLTFVKEMLEG